MLSQSKLKLIRSLEHKKARRETGLFVAEGPKVVGDLMKVMSPQLVVSTDKWLEQNSRIDVGTEVVRVTEQELRKASFLQHPQQVLAIFPIPCNKIYSPDQIVNKLSLALDGIQDPGNLGTIIRIADWFGIETVFCSPETADAYSPKVIQATMGSIARVVPVYADLAQLIKTLPMDFPVYGTLLDGENLYGQQLSDTGLIVMGNEGNGISPTIRQLVNRKILIPHWPAKRETTDSLNVAIATAVACAEFRRRL